MVRTTRNTSTANTNQSWPNIRSLRQIGALLALVLVGGLTGIARSGDTPAADRFSDAATADMSSYETRGVCVETDVFNRTGEPLGFLLRVTAIGQPRSEVVATGLLQPGESAHVHFYETPGFEVENLRELLAIPLGPDCLFEARVDPAPPGRNEGFIHD